MLILEQYGVKLIRLQKEHIEIVRYWRNQSDITNFMEYKNYITPKAQLKWFANINNELNYYFIIEFENKKIGLINAKDYNTQSGFGEGGIFIWDKHYIDSFAAVFSSLCLLNFVFFELKLSAKSVARILKTNPTAINYNKRIGYKLIPNQENIDNQLYELTLEDYIRYGSKLNEAAGLVCKRSSELKYSGTVCEQNIKEINNLLLTTLK
jgi:RimJ/RimL family protein N-acetyltransferase